MQVAGTAAVVFGGAAFFGTLIELKIVHATGVDEIKIAARLVTTLIWALAVVFYAGLLDLVVGAYIEGRPDPTITETVRALPITRLFVANFLLAVGTAIGLLLLIVPGIVFFTLCVFVGPIIVTERLSIRQAFVRSAHLARHHFWRVLLIVTIPVAVEDEIMHSFDPTYFDHPLIASFVLTALIGMLVGSVVGVLEVVMAHELRDRDPLPTPATSTATS